MNRLIIITLLFFCCNAIIAQEISGIIINETNEQPIEFVNIGVVGKNVGTVSDISGKFKLIIDTGFNNDTLMFSRIGFNPFFIKVANLRKNHNNKIVLHEKTCELTEVVVRPQVFKQKTLGVTTKFKKISGGFKDNLLGYECGILMKVKKRALLRKVIINISYCSYDTIFYRLNIYKVQGKMNFENILKEPIYVKLPKESVKENIQINLESKNIIVKGDFLITLEHIKDLGKGSLFFCAGITDKTYYKKTSQGIWETAPVGISISAIVDDEK